MGIFSKFFEQKRKSSDPELQFGRYTDTYKTDDKYKSWDIAIEHFENEKYLVSYTHFLDFLKSDSHQNVSYTTENGKILFSIYQGSKLISGEADFKKCKAEAKIVKTKKLPLGLMRQLLEENFDLRYTRYTIDDDDCISLKFDTFVEDGSPHKIYQALKELATEADRKDDLLMDTFEGLEPINNNHTRPISDNEKKIKYHFFKKWCENVLHEIDLGKLNPFLYPGGISFLILDFLYKTDYLIKPEGKVMEQIREGHDLFFNESLITVHEKNKILIKMVRDLEKVTAESLAKELYEVNSTFGTSMPEGHQRLVDIIDAQMTDFDWYYENKFHTFANAICGYVAGFSLFAYSLPEPSKALLKLFYMITENKYFNELGFNEEYYLNDVFYPKNIHQAIKYIITDNKEKYPGIQVDNRYLQYDDLPTFSRSFLQMISNMQYPEYL